MSDTFFGRKNEFAYVEWTSGGPMLVDSNGEPVSLSPQQTELLQLLFDIGSMQALFGSKLSDITYVAGEIVSYSRFGISHTVTRPDANTIIVANAQGAQKTVTLDGSGKVTAIN